MTWLNFANTFSQEFNFQMIILLDIKQTNFYSQVIFSGVILIEITVFYAFPSSV